MINPVSLVKVSTYPDRPGYERTSSSLWKQREEYCAKLLQAAWRGHHKHTVKKGANARDIITNNKEGEKPLDSKVPSNGKQVIEVQPSPSPTN